MSAALACLTIGEIQSLLADSFQCLSISRFHFPHTETTTKSHLVRTVCTLFLARLFCCRFCCLVLIFIFLFFICYYYCEIPVQIISIFIFLLLQPFAFYVATRCEIKNDKDPSSISSCWIGMSAERRGALWWGLGTRQQWVGFLWQWFPGGTSVSKLYGATLLQRFLVYTAIQGIFFFQCPLLEQKAAFV